MSNSTTFRVKRNPPVRLFTRHTYRDAWPFLMSDFQKRCAYSMQHISRAGGPRNMQVDHFNPNLKKKYFHEYSNLFLSTSHCNGAKSDRWPTNRERANNWRFLDCTKEIDYGAHILEDPDTHELVGVTPEGRYHVLNCDLNSPHFIEERTKRAEYWTTLHNMPVSMDSLSLPKELRQLLQVLEEMIPIIPYLSGEALERHRQKRRERDTHTSEKFGPQY